MADKAAPNENEFCGSNVRRYLMYTAIIALCIAAIFYMLMHAKPSVAPAVKDHSTQSRIALPCSPAHTTQPVSFSSARRG